MKKLSNTRGHGVCTRRVVPWRWFLLDEFKSLVFYTFKKANVYRRFNL